jgi:predicted MarR family transcription regulator
MYAPSKLDLAILSEIRKKEGKSIREVCTRFFPRYSEPWVRERIRLLTITGYLEVTSKGYAHTLAVTLEGQALLQQEAAAV